VLSIDNHQVLHGQTVYGDDTNPATFYVLPDAPSIRIGADGKPAFTFLKYREPLDHGNGVIGGGFLIFDTALQLSDNVMSQIKGDLQGQVNNLFANSGKPPPQVTVGQIDWSQGSVSVTVFADADTFVQKVTCPQSPSLYGDNVTTVAVELSQFGADLAEAALKGEHGLINVVYTLKFWTVLPKISGKAWFYADEFYSFAQTIKIDSDIWGEDSYQQTMSETFSSSKSLGVEIDGGIGTDQSVIDQVRAALQKDLDDQIKSEMEDQLKAVDASQTGDRGDDYLSRNFTKTKITNYYETFEENQCVEWPVNPQAAVSLNGMKLPDGTAVNPADYITEVDLNDPWFQTQRIFVSAPVKWGPDTPIDSIDVSIIYGANNSKGKTLTLTQSAQTQTFEAFRDNDGNNWSWSATVNYVGEDHAYVIPPSPASQDTVLSVDGALAGILAVQIQPGNILWDKVKSAEVTVHYEPDGAAQPIENTYTLMTDAKTATWTEVLFQPWNKPYKYKVMYTMSDGTTYNHDWIQVDARNPLLQINSPFHATKLVTIRGVGDFDQSIASVDLSLSYNDPGNNYSQTNILSLNKTTPFATWPIPVIDPNAGTLTYSGTLRRINGATDDIVATIATGNLIEVGDRFADVLSIKFDPSLIDWTKVALVKAVVTYTDPAHGINKSLDAVIHPADKVVPPVVIDVMDATKESYSWSATYFMKDNSQQSLPSTATTDQSPILPATP
jgi:hypothetical protein